MRKNNKSKNLQLNKLKSLKLLNKNHLICKRNHNKFNKKNRNLNKMKKNNS